MFLMEDQESFTDLTWPILEPLVILGERSGLYPLSKGKGPFYWTALCEYLTT